MRRDWDRRARSDAQRFIACGHAESDDQFWASGRRDLEAIVLRSLVLGARARVLEIGCGMGRLLRPLAERVESAWGVDISPEMIAKAKEALSGVRNAEVALTNGDLRQFRDATFDLVYSFIVFQHIPAKRSVLRYIREAARILKAGGILRFQVDGRPRTRFSATDTWLGVWYSPVEIRRELAAAGFEEVDLWGEGTHYLWVTALRKLEGGRPSAVAVGAQRRAWNRQALEHLLARLGADPSPEADAILLGDRSLRQLAQTFLDEHGSRPPEDFVRRAYQVILGREPDTEGLAFYSNEIARGVSPENTVDCLLSSVELEDKLRPIVEKPR